MNFASDNRGPAHPKILEAVMRANEGYAPSYGGDDLTAQVCDQLREVFEAPDAAVFLTATGGSTNALILATLANPWDEIYCAQDSHIRHDECNGVEDFTGGARITYVNDADKIDPDALDRTISEAAPHGVHNAQPGPVSMTQVTDLGGVYCLNEIQAVTAVARKHGLPVHMDGARFANALEALGCSPAEMTWKSGVDAVSFGCTKNGCMGVEAAIFFDPAKGHEFELRRKRAGHLFSKHRFLAAQVGAYLTDDLWRSMAQSSNANGQRLFDGLRQINSAEFLAPADANLGFIWLPRAAHRRAVEAGAVYEVMGSLEGPDDEKLLSRFVVDWSAKDADVDALLGHLRG